MSKKVKVTKVEETVEEVEDVPSQPTYTVTPGKKPPPQFVLLERRKRVAAYYLQGFRQAEIAQLVGVSFRVIEKDLEFLRNEWRQRVELDFDVKQAEELAKLDKIEQEAWDSFLKSKEVGEVIRDRTESVRVNVPREKGTPRRKKDSHPGSAHTLQPIKHVREVIKKGQAGDPRFLDIIQGVVKTRLQLLGLLKAGSGEGGTTVNLNWGDLVMGQSQSPASFIEARPSSSSQALPAPASSPVQQDNNEGDPVEDRILAAAAGQDRHKTRPLGLPDNSPLPTEAPPPVVEPSLNDLYPDENEGE